MLLEEVSTIAGNPVGEFDTKQAEELPKAICSYLAQVMRVGSEIEAGKASNFWGKF